MTDGTKFSFRVEMKHGQDIRHVDADCFSEEGEWLVFHRKPPVGGTREYWRLRLESVVSIETIKKVQP